MLLRVKNKQKMPYKKRKTPSSRKIPHLRPNARFGFKKKNTIFTSQNNKSMNKSAIIAALRHYFSTQPVLKAWLFGSFSRGEETYESDIDIIVSLDKSQPIGLKFFGMWSDLEELLGRKVDLVSEGTLLPFAKKSVDKDKILVYERKK